MVLDFFAEAFDMNVYRAGIADVHLAPDMGEELFSRKDLVW